MTESDDGETGTFVCQGCGDTVAMDVPANPWDCVRCGEPVVHVEQNKVVPMEDLREKIEQWREHEHQPVYKRASNDLEAVLERYE